MNSEGISANGQEKNAQPAVKPLRQEPYGYEWPASRLTGENMSCLRSLSNRLKRPVNQLIKEAVECYALLMRCEPIEGEQELRSVGQNECLRYPDSLISFFEENSPANSFGLIAELWQTGSMNGRAKGTGLESSDIESELQQLREEVRVLRDVIDEIRELIEYATLNGLPMRPHAPHGVVKQMPIDPCAPDWRSRVVVVRTVEEAEQWNEQLAQREASEDPCPQDTSTENEAKRDGMLF